MNVTNALPHNPILVTMIEFLQERKLTNEEIMINALLKKAVWEIIRLFIEEWNLTNSMNETKALPNNSILVFIKVFIQERIYTKYECFTEKGSLRIQRRTCTRGKHYKYIECGICFTHLYHLRFHQIIHIREIPHKCECDKCFTQKVSLW